MCSTSKSQVNYVLLLFARVSPNHPQHVDISLDNETRESETYKFYIIFYHLSRAGFQFCLPLEPLQRNEESTRAFCSFP